MRGVIDFQPACPRNAVDVKMFWVRIYKSTADSQLALYAYPLGWLVLLCVSVLKFNISCGVSLMSSHG